MTRRPEPTRREEFGAAIAELSLAFSNLQAGFVRLQDCLPSPDQPVRVCVSTTADVLGPVPDVCATHVPSSSRRDVDDLVSRRRPASRTRQAGGSPVSLPGAIVRRLRSALERDESTALVAAIRAAHDLIGPADEVDEPATPPRSPPRSPISISSEEEDIAPPSGARASANASSSGAAAMASASYRGRQATAVSAPAVSAPAPPPTPVGAMTGNAISIPTPDELAARLASAPEHADYWVVSAGTNPGIYRSWLAASANTSRVSCSRHILKKSKSNALQTYTEEYEAGRVEAIA